MGRVLHDEWAAYWPAHADEPAVRLELQSAQPFKSGVLNLSYAPVAK